MLHAIGCTTYRRLPRDKGLTVSAWNRAWKMSTFNLDRFRFDKKPAATANKEQGCDSKSPESEKENKPGN